MASIWGELKQRNVVKVAEIAVHLNRRSGLRVSRAGDCVKPPPEIIDEFLTHPMTQ